MNHQELVKLIAKEMLIKEGSGKLESFISLHCLCSYFSEISIDQLMGIASQYGINYPLDL